MEVIKREEHGYDMALYGLSLSFKDEAIPFEKWWTGERCEKLIKTVKVLSSKDGGHNKFLESMVVWIDIKAPRFWWSEFDTYRVGVTKQSGSTMHTLAKRELFQIDFEYPIPQSCLSKMNQRIRENRLTIAELKNLLPDGFLQRRLVCLNYKVLRHMILQRRNHRLPQWIYFINQIREQVQHPELLPELPSRK